MCQDVEILLVEDNPADVRLAEEALKEGGVPLHLNVTPDGVEALAFLRRHGRYAAAPRPDLILLDLNLPRKGGREVLAEVKNDPDLCRIPVVVLTTSEAPADINHSYDLQANCYVTKSADLDQYFDVMRRIEDYWLRIVRRPAGTALLTATKSIKRQPTVLAIDDDTDIIEFLRDALETEGYRVLSGLGEEALRIARADRPDVILLDMLMPGLDGTRLSRRLRDDPATSDIPIVVMSAHTTLRASATLLPGNDWLPKPFRLEDLYTTVARWISAR